jgi:hypothetical protein
MGVGSFSRVWISDGTTAERQSGRRIGDSVFFRSSMGQKAGITVDSVVRVCKPGEIVMPVTRSELLFLCGGALAGAVAAKNYAKIKEKVSPLKERVSPWLATAGEAVGDAYTAAARRVGERIEAMQDAMAETHHAERPQEANGRTP